MKTFLGSLTAVALMLSVGHAIAQPAATAPASGDTVIASGVTPGSYRDTNSAGKRVEVTTPYGGNSQSQANANEVKITQRLNQQQLQVPPTSP